MKFLRKRLIQLFFTVTTAGLRRPEPLYQTAQVTGEPLQKGWGRGGGDH
jgi:hypothetical protein